jgi:hypothetical protein
MTMTMLPLRRRHHKASTFFAPTAFLVLAAAVLALPTAAIAQPEPEHFPANRITVASASTVQMIEAHSAADAIPGEPTELLRAEFRTSARANALIRFDAECAILTALSGTTEEDGEVEARATLHAWVELDGQPVPVSREDGDDGSIALCNGGETVASLEIDADEISEKYLRLRQTHGFSWAASEIGNGVHELRLLGQLEVSVEGGNGDNGDNGDDDDEAGAEASALALVGARTMIVEPHARPNNMPF